MLCNICGFIIASFNGMVTDKYRRRFLTQDVANLPYEALRSVTSPSSSCNDFASESLVL
jgi:hypothetical protein